MLLAVYDFLILIGQQNEFDEFGVFNDEIQHVFEVVLVFGHYLVEILNDDTNLSSP